MSLLPPECPKCNTAHWRHEACPAGTKSKAVIVPKEVYGFPVTIPESVINRQSDDQGVINSVINKDDIKKAQQRGRAAKWRAKHREKYTSDMKEVMRKKRARI